ncbi:glycoside hydrolase family 38 protein [Serpula lacrymans var. lacrymans S7.3]|uniref:Alpha-mannosidase n=1 Tax=Serpula lacrymans var. lacrymans (strain S7.3) TaxID=936435 RepID=F8QAL8_SERL3|nr:glycoside hydrolase family 38 protein [Serpula lacrymans var. lacrymans S7.3]
MSGSEYPQLNFGTGAKWIKNLTRDRLNNFSGGHFSDVNLSSVLFTHRLDAPEYVKLQVWSAPGLTKPFFEEATKQKFKPAKKGDSFGPSWTNHWWKVSVNIPADWQQYERVQFEFDPGCEAMIYSTEGVPLQGITGGYGGDRRVEYIIPLDARQQGHHEFIIESSCNGMFGVPWNGDTIAPPDMNRYFQLASADLVVPNQEAWRLLWDFTTLREIIDTLPGNSPLQNKALVTANEIMNIFRRGNSTDIANARKLAENVFGEGWEAKGAEIYAEGPERAQIVSISYCHIVAELPNRLWPYSVTQQKTARSWSTQIDLMERYPEHRFACSQAQQFKWLEQQYPPLFERVREKVKSGQFHLIGGAWVENDGNMPSGEALVRQFLYGQKYFESRFGKRCETAWLPDSFGLTAAYPQLIRDAGMKYFFTQKNVFPHSTFNWVGIDGSQVLCHMTPVDTYTAQASVGDVNKGVTNHKNLESNDTALLVFGNGDGGGGALPKMLENLRRIRAATNGHRDLPSVNMGHSVEEFFENIDKDSQQGKRLPNWRGELYLEFHRGTYTSHGSIKKGNRKSEILLRDLERVATFATLFKAKDSTYVYPKKTIDDSWEKVLLNQFLPGSAIGMVYDDAEKLYGEVRKACDSALEEAFQALFAKSIPVLGDRSIKALSQPSDLIAINTTSFSRRDVVKIPLQGSGSALKSLKSKIVQVSTDGAFGYALMNCSEGDNVATATGLFADSLPVSGGLVVFTNGSDHFVLRNASVQLTISDGRITSLVDVKLGRELIPKGSTGGLVIFEDRPNYWDAWDVEIHHLETPNLLKFSKVEVVAEGPLRAAVKTQVKYGQSTIDVTISLDAITASHHEHSRSFFTFDAVVDWHERHEFLKFELPLNINSADATYETRFGHLQRPTHKNTTLDAAKFEVCGHKYADLSEYGYGVAFLSESKYGFACHGNVLRISLLRGATAPDAEQDQGKHEFSWAVMPHKGHFLESDVPMAAFLFNSPLHVRLVPSVQQADKVSVVKQPFHLDGGSNIFLETIKRGEDDFAPNGSNTTIILRLYEAFGGHGQVKLKIASHVPILKAYVTNLLEDDKAELRLFETADRDRPRQLKLDFRGFEVKTVKLVLGSNRIAEATKSR